MRMTRAYIVIFCAIAGFAVKSQNLARTDSVKKVLESENLSTGEELEAYYWLSVYSGSPEDELNYGNQLLELATKSENKEYIIQANLRIGVAHRLLGNLGKALESLFVSAQLAASSDQYKPLLADIYQEISTSYTQNGDSENALLYGSKTIEILRSTGNKQRLALTLLNAGYDYYLIEKYDSAMSYYNESEPILEEVGMTIGLAYIIGNRALVYWKQGNSEKAKEDLKTAISMLEPLGDLFGMSDYYIRLGNIYLEDQDYNQAITNITNGLNLATQEGFKEQIRDGSLLLFTVYQDRGSFQKALEYQSMYYAYKDSIQNLETTQRLADLRTSYEVGQKQAIVDLLLEQKRSDQIIKVTGGALLFGVACIALIAYRHSKAKAKLNNQLQEQKDSLVELNNTKDKFFSIISHDLRGPVGNMSGLVGITRMYLEENNRDELKDTLGKMETSVDRLTKLLDNLLHWAMLQRGKFPYTPESLSVKDTVEDVADMFEFLANSKAISVNVGAFEDFEIFADKNTVTTAFRNLLSNAIKFTPNRGKINITAKKDDSSGCGIIYFTDSGIGISSENQKILFRLGNSKKSKGTSGETGLGLGLQLVYEFVQLNKGKIEVESEEGKGTTFSVHLPLNQPNVL